jgi:hypothetical protein
VHQQHHNKPYMSCRPSLPERCLAQCRIDGVDITNCHTTIKHTPTSFS